MLLNFANQINSDLVSSKFDNVLGNDAFQTYLRHTGTDNFQSKFKNFLLSLYEPLVNDYPYVIDKTPRYWEIIDEIKKIFPNSRMIILKRNPVDVFKSIINTWNKGSIELLEPYKRDLLLAPKRLHEFSLKHKNDPLVKTVYYENIVDDQLNEIERIYEWLGISFQIDFLDTKRNVKIKGKYGDPYQNSGKSYKQTKSESKDLTKNNDELKGLLLQYQRFLGDQFLQEYGNYPSTKGDFEISNLSPFFRTDHLHKTKEDYKKELQRIKSSKTFKIASKCAYFFKKLKVK